MELLITRQLLLFLQSILLGLSAGVLYDLLRPFRTLVPRLTGFLDFLYGLTLTAAVFAFLLRPADGELRGYMLLGTLGGVILFFGLLSRPLRAVWSFWAGTVAEFAALLVFPFMQLKVFLKKTADWGKNLFYFAAKCYTITQGRWNSRPPARGRGQKRARKTGGILSK